MGVEGRHRRSASVIDLGIDFALPERWPHPLGGQVATILILIFGCSCLRLFYPDGLAGGHLCPYHYFVLLPLEDTGMCRCWACELEQSGQSRSWRRPWMSRN